MAWRPNDNLMEGELDNRSPGKVTGWMRFYRRGKEPLKVDFDLDGDFHEDIRGKVIRLKNPKPSDRNAELDRDGSYVDGFVPMQRGTAGDITAGFPLGPLTEDVARDLIAQLEITWDKFGIDGEQRERLRRGATAAFRDRIAQGDLHHAYVDYPYVEWFSDNGRVVLELDPSQVEVLGGGAPVREKTPAELVEDKRKRSEAMDTFMGRMVDHLSEENRKKGGDGNVTGIVVS